MNVSSVDEDGTRVPARAESSASGGHGRDNERLCSTSEAFIDVAMERLMLRHLARL